MAQSTTAYLRLPDRDIAYQQIDGDPFKPGILFLGGWGSSLTGTKASFLAERCADNNLRYVRFDWRGHGISSGKFHESTIGDWLADAHDVFSHITDGQQIIVGSSMGGWIGLLLARNAPQRIRGLVGVAAAPDFTEKLIIPALSEEQKTELEETGITYAPHSPDERLPVTKRFLEEARNHLVTTKPLNLQCPVHLLQGQLDTEVPWSHAISLASNISNNSVNITLIKDGTHRLGRPKDLYLLWRTIEGLL